MKINQLLSVHEARRGNYGREQSHQAGQQLGRDIASGLPSADQARTIQANKALANQGQSTADVQARLARYKSAKAAGAANTSTTPPTTTGGAGAANTSTTPPTTTGGAGAFDQMTGQLAANPTQSSTGGSTTGGTGVVNHTANPNNPNQTNTTPPTSDADPSEIARLAGLSPDANPTPTSTAPSTGEKVANFGRKAAGMAGGFIRGLGNVAGELGNAAGQIATAPLGGAVRGYQTARQGGSFTSATSPSQPGYVGGSGSNVSSRGAPGEVSRDEIADLKQTIANMGQRLNRAGIAEKKIN